jgi:hypothetical protein
MGYASKLGRARISARNPRAAGVCDRCGGVFNHVDLRFQFDWRGTALMNTRLLVCQRCEDMPQNQLRAVVIPADPMPIMNPRTQDYVTAETNTRATSGQNTVDPETNIPVIGGDTRITENDDIRVTQQTGEPPNGLNIMPGSLLNEVDYGDPNLPYNTTAIPKTGWLPGVNYVVWDNGVLIQTGWYNDQGELVTWLSIAG